MTKLVVHGATLACSMGSAPSKLSILPANETYGGSSPAATVQDMRPEANLAPFGMCQSPINPQVASATAAAGGTLTPQPCVPAAAGPWTPGSKSVAIMGTAGPALLNDPCQCSCQWGGTIQVQDAGQTGIEVD
ncbi:MAG: DUF4280 domain-containing protein [Polyangiaceae bacterium]